MTSAARASRDDRFECGREFHAAAPPPTVCGGDGLKDARTLHMASMSAAAARQLTQQVNYTESTVTPARREQTFDGMVHMKSDGSHPASPHAAKH